MNENEENLCDAIELLYGIDPTPSDGSVEQLIEIFEHKLDCITAQSMPIWSDE